MISQHDAGILFWLPEMGADWSDDLAAAIETDPSGRRLREVCSRRLGISQLRAVKNAMASAAINGATFDGLRSVRLGLVGAGTLDFLGAAIPGTAPRFGLRIDVAPIRFNGLATAAFGDPGFEDPVDIIAVVPDASSFRRPEQLLDRRGHDESVQRALEELFASCQSLRDRHQCAIVLATIAPSPDAMVTTGERAIPGSYSAFLNDVNAGIVDMASSNGWGLWDVERIAALIGFRVWRDPIAMHVAKSPFSVSLAALAADRLCATIAATMGKSRRVLVLDLDNTCWGGVIGDDGVSGIVVGQGDPLGEAFLAVQRAALELRRRGVVLAVCSKNDDAVARTPFRDHPDMLLREEHIAVFQANWSDKATNITTIADALALNLDALVFLDDNPAERARVRQELPEVAVPELPDDPALFATFLAAGGYFETVNLNPDDLKRADTYRENAKRAEIRQSIGNYQEYLASLKMVLSVARFDKLGRPRIVQLINKSNQFNLTSRRRQDSDVEAIEVSSSHLGLYFRLEDCFGDNGMISVVILAFEGDTTKIDTWLMSCRVLERDVETAVLNEIVRFSQQAGMSTLLGEFIPSQRNALVKDHYAKLGFSQIVNASQDENSATRWLLDIRTYVSRQTPIDIIAHSDVTS